MTCRAERFQPPARRVIRMLGVFGCFLVATYRVPGGQRVVKMTCRAERFQPPSRRVIRMLCVVECFLVATYLMPGGRRVVKMLK